MKKQKGKTFAIIGTICSCGPLVGLIGTVIAMLSAFQTIGSESKGSPEALANDIDIHLISTAIGLCLGILGIVLILIALLGSKYRAPWFFWVLCVLSALWMTGFPVGTIAGIGLLIYLLRNKAEFKKEQSTNNSSKPTCFSPVE
ncbi:MAG TPA: MotA/TolQ/ExbB proton channel family protein [Pontiellaceae bacterium]|nr:MotA/TolQ/ExbB proton channel family protein [Pontiellaceae bacterium]